MRFENVFVAILCISSLTAFQFPVVADSGVAAPSTDCSVYFLKVAHDVNKIVELVQKHDYSAILPIAIDLSENIKAAYDCLRHTEFSDAVSNINSIGSDCPFIKCITKEFNLIYIHTVQLINDLAHGNFDEAKKLVPAIIKEINDAAHCFHH